MSNKSIPERKRLAALFASFAIVIMGAASLLESMSLDFYTVLGTLEKIVPAATVLGGIGWVMGMVLDKPRRRNVGGSRVLNNVFLNEVMKSPTHSENNTQKESSESAEKNTSEEVDGTKEAG